MARPAEGATAPRLRVAIGMALSMFIAALVIAGTQNSQGEQESAVPSVLLSKKAPPAKAAAAPAPPKAATKATKPKATKLDNEQDGEDTFLDSLNDFWTGHQGSWWADQQAEKKGPKLDDLVGSDEKDVENEDDTNLDNVDDAADKLEEEADRLEKEKDDASDEDDDEDQDEDEDEEDEPTVSSSVAPPVKPKKTSLNLPIKAKNGLQTNDKLRVPIPGSDDIQMDLPGRGEDRRKIKAWGISCVEDGNAVRDADVSRKEADHAIGVSIEHVNTAKELYAKELAHLRAIEREHEVSRKHAHVETTVAEAARHRYLSSIQQTASRQRSLVRTELEPLRQRIATDVGQDIATDKAAIAAAANQEKRLRSMYRLALHRRLFAEKVERRVAALVSAARTRADAGKRLVARAENAVGSAKADADMADSQFQEKTALYVQCQAKVRAAADRLRKIAADAESKSATAGEVGAYHYHHGGT